MRGGVCFLLAAPFFCQLTITQRETKELPELLISYCPFQSILEYMKVLQH